MLPWVGDGGFPSCLRLWFTGASAGFGLGVEVWSPAAYGLMQSDSKYCWKLEGGAEGLGWETPWLSERTLQREGKCECKYRRATAFVPVHTRGFLADNHPDASPSELTPMRDCLYLVDGGLAINSPFPLALWPQRAVDLILSFDYSLEAPFEVSWGQGCGEHLQ